MNPSCSVMEPTETWLVRIDQLEDKANRLNAELERLRLLIPHWRPIETVPRDGSFVQLLYPCSRVPFMGRPTGPDAREFEGFWCQPSRISSPTHWMPLPEPPPAVGG